MNRLALLGLGLTLAGLSLAAGFWPLTSISGAELLASWNADPSPGYAGYEPGARITVHERVLNVSDPFPLFASTVTAVELEDGNPDQSMVVYVEGDARPVVAPGAVIYAEAVLQVIPNISFYYWKIGTPQDVRPSWPVDAIFYGIMATGVAILAYAALRKP